MPSSIQPDHAAQKPTICCLFSLVLPPVRARVSGSAIAILSPHHPWIERDYAGIWPYANAQSQRVPGREQGFCGGTGPLRQAMPEDNRLVTRRSAMQRNSGNSQPLFSDAAGSPVMNHKADNWEKKDTSKSEDDKLDDALEDSFPASDPPSQTEPCSKVGSKHKAPQHAPHDQR